MNIRTILMASVAVITLGHILPAHAASAYQDEQSDSALSGFYFGGYGGYSWSDVDLSPGPSFDVNGGDYGLFAGYQFGHFFDRSLGMTAAIEFNYGWSDADDSAGGTDANKNQEWGVSFRPGFAFVDKYAPFGLKPYGIFGYRRAEFSVDTPVGSGDEDFNGFELGIGTELLAYQQFGVRLDYSHVFYSEHGDVDPDEDDIRLGLAYHF